MLQHAISLDNPRCCNIPASRKADDYPSESCCRLKVNTQEQHPVPTTSSDRQHRTIPQVQDEEVHQKRRRIHQVHGHVRWQDRQFPGMEKSDTDAGIQQLPFFKGVSERLFGLPRPSTPAKSDRAAQPDGHVSPPGVRDEDSPLITCGETSNPITHEIWTCPRLHSESYNEIYPRGYLKTHT